MEMTIKHSMLALVVIGASFGAQAQTCPVDVRNDIHIVDNTVSLYQEQQPKVLIDENYQLYINGQRVTLDDAQQKAVEAYSQHVQQYLPQVAAVAEEGSSMAKSVIAELASAFDSNEAFTEVDKLVDEYTLKARKKFYKDDQFVMPADIFTTAETSWKEEFEQVMQRLSGASMSAVFSALKEEMKEGELNFTEFQNKMSELKSSMENQIKIRSADVAEKAGNVCDSMQGLAQEEQALHEKIPALKDYPMFEI